MISRYRCLLFNRKRYLFCPLSGCTTKVGPDRAWYSNNSSSSSVFPSEISKFSQLSSTWWDPKRNPLIAMNPIRVKYIVTRVQQQEGFELRKDRSNPPLAGLSVLDVGCGAGVLAESLARLGAKVSAIDPSTALVQQAKRHAKLHPLTRSIDYKGGWTVEQFAGAQPTSTFDVICLSEVIEHVADIDSVLCAVASLLKKSNGLLFVSTLNRTITSKLLAVFGAEYVAGWVPPGTHDWNQFKSPTEVQELMLRAGLTQIDVQGMVVEVPPLLLGRWRWHLDPLDTDMNWIGVYQHSRVDEVLKV